MTNKILSLMRLMQFSDSAFPIGTFSFSNGLETAVHEKIVYDSETLEKFTQSLSLQTAYSDGIAAIQAFRSVLNNDIESVEKIDERLIQMKMNDEARTMQKRMGKKMIETSSRLFDNPIIIDWLKKISDNKVSGTFPISQAITFAVAGLSEIELFCSHQYGVINMVLGAALRCVRVSHFDTQQILFKLSNQSEELYHEISKLDIDDMSSFMPQIDILAALHEKGTMRMFMN